MATAPESRGELGPTSLRLSAGAGQSWLAVLVVMGFAAFWNGVVWYRMPPFFGEVAQDPDGEPHWWQVGGLLFSVPFVLVGIGLALLAAYILLKQLFTPRVRVTITPAALSPGGALRVQWTVTERERLLDLRFGLECREEVLDPPRGKNRTRSLTCTQRKVLPLWEMPDVDAEGDRRVNLPADLLDVSAREGGDLRWYLTVRGRVAWLPDVADDLAVTVARVPPAT